MNRKFISEVLNALDEKYIAEAAEFKPVKKKNRWRSAAACAVLCCAIGMSAYAGGLLDPLIVYFSGDPLPERVQMAENGLCVSDGTVTLRLERALCDDHAGRAVVSFLGLPKAAQDLAIQDDFSYYGIDRQGDRVDMYFVESATYTADSCKREAVTHYPDADMTFVLTWQCKLGMDKVERLVFAYKDLTLEWETDPVRLPEYPLEAANGVDTGITDLTLSGIGIYFHTDDEYAGGRILLLYPDGSVEEPGYSASLDIDYFVGLWGEVVDIGYHAPEELLGLRIDDVDYYFTE